MYKRLRDMREDRDLKQRELAEMLNVSQTTYSRYESGELDIPNRALLAKRNLLCSSFAGKKTR